MWRITLIFAFRNSTSNGTFILKWGTFGSANSQFKYPWGVAVDSLGNVYVADQQNLRVQKFNSNGGFITKWGIYGTGNGQFQNPWGVAVDGEDNVWVTDLAGGSRKLRE